MADQPPETYPLPTRNKAVLDYLSSRRSNLAKVMGDPGPTEEELDQILTIAARVPDHRKLAPWRFIVFQGEDRAKAGIVLRDAYLSSNPDHSEDRSQFEADRFLRAPIVIAVVSSPVNCPRGTPKWEQELSAGAVCMNLLMAAQASGYGAQWLTEWYAYDDTVLRAFGLSEEERIAGYLYLGTPNMPSSERARPKLEELKTNSETLWEG